MNQETLAKFKAELNSVPWNELKHAYGPADDTPDWILALCSDDSAWRQKAIQQLGISIFHQGSIYSASLASVPFLHKLVKDNADIDRHEILLLLLHLAIGYPHEWLPAGFDINIWAKLALKIYHSSDYVELLIKLYQEVRKYVFSWVELLTESDLQLRIATGYALAWFREDAATVVPYIRQSLKQATNESETANHILSLGLLNGYLDPSLDIEWLQAFLQHENSKVIRTCAAVALANLSPQIADENVISALFDGLDDLESPPIFHWNNGFIRNYVALSLGSLGKYVPEQVVPGLCDAMTYTNLGAIIAITQGLGETLFPEKLSEKDDFLSLNQHQRIFLEALADNWIDIIGEHTIDLNLSGILRSHGLPDEYSKLVAFVSKH